MKLRLVIAAFTAASAALAVPVANAPAQNAQRDWTRTVVTTPEGGYRMGNPDAPVKVIEYLSLVCPHCAHFAAAGRERLIGHFVRSGRVSLEYRSYVLNGTDVAATLLARCASPANYFEMSEQFLASQGEWMARVQAIAPAQRQQLMALSGAERLVRLAEIAGLIQIAARHGVPAAQARRCLTDQTAFNRLGQMRQAAAELGVQGTPTFLINGIIQPVNDWPALEPLIRQAGG